MAGQRVSLNTSRPRSSHWATPLTCIIAARGTESAVLVSDRLVSRGNEVYERGKLEVFEISWP